MAERVVVTLVDDLDGSVAEKTVSFALDGTSYEIDLSDANAQELRDALAPYIEVARKVSGPGRRKGRRTVASGPTATEIREWAISQGKEVSARGRVPLTLRDEYLKAHS